MILSDLHRRSLSNYSKEEPPYFQQYKRQHHYQMVALSHGIDLQAKFKNMDCIIPSYKIRK
jgi:hypothetical protein